MIVSCISQKSALHRIRLFGRFLELYDEIQPTYYAKYLEMIEYFTNLILNFKIEDEVESILLPTVRLSEC